MVNRTVTNLVPIRLAAVSLRHHILWREVCISLRTFLAFFLLSFFSRLQTYVPKYGEPDVTIYCYFMKPFTRQGDANHTRFVYLTRSYCKSYMFCLYKNKILPQVDVVTLECRDFWHVAVPIAEQTDRRFRSE